MRYTKIYHKKIKKNSYNKLYKYETIWKLIWIWHNLETIGY